MRRAFGALVLAASVIAACGGPSGPAASPPPSSTAHPGHPPPDDAEEMEEEEKEKEETLTGSGPCKKDLAHCSPSGCAKPGSPHALFNELKRRTTDVEGRAVTRETAKTISFDQLRQLQAAADAACPDPKDLTKPQRDRLVTLAVTGGTFGEGTGVRIAGFIAPDNGSPSSGAHTGGIESVNCRLTKDGDRDVHIPFVPRPDQPECEGVVVEPIPQMRAEHPSWGHVPMRRLAKQKKLVMFVGPLFFDNEHKVNPDCGHLLRGQPRRMSLWEIHPVTEVYVCESGTSCSADDHAGWMKVD